MKKTLVACGIGLLLSCSAQAQTTKTAQFAKVGVGTLTTLGMSYALWRLYRDISTDPKRYMQSQHYIRSNIHRLTSDTFSVLGLGYLTWQSGLYTLEAIKDLVVAEDDEEDLKP